MKNINLQNLKTRQILSPLKYKKAIVLITCFYVMVILLGLSTISFMRMANESKLSQISIDSKQAFYEAESGIAYAQAEAARNGFTWFTHILKNQPATGVITNIQGAAIDTGGFYIVSGKNFKVQAFPETIDGNPTGVITILSQGQSNGITRTLEYRLGQKCAYEYFMFFPEGKTVGSVTYNGRNFGGMHINGNILLSGNPRFYFLTELTSGSNDPNKGFIYRANSQYANYHGEINYNNYVTSPARLNWSMYSNSTYRVRSRGTTTFRTGDMANYIDTKLNYYLSGPNAYWEYDKYSGSANNTTPAHVKLDNSDLKNTATYEMIRGSGRVNLFSNQKIIIEYEDGTPSSTSLKEEDAFQIAYNAERDGKDIDWTKFWGTWKENHSQDYTKYHNDGTLKGGSDWERRFFMASYNWRDSEGGNGIPDGINKEWWEDLSYGDDRASLNNDRAPAALESYYTGDSYESYFFNSKKQTSAWSSWLADNGLNKKDTNKTLVKDASQGGKYVDPGNILSSTSTDYNYIQKKAQNGGIFIGMDKTKNEFVNPISGCVVEDNFYNSQHPARDGKKYKPSSVLNIDVNCLRNKIENDKATNGPLKDFNGILYVDLDEYNWSISNFDSKADGVMLTNGERLPDGGLSVVTPNNVYVKGNYNLDPEGQEDLNREPDSSLVIDYVIEKQPYISGENDLKWQPAEIITKRPIYTLSEDFNKPTTMPLIDYHYYQYYDEHYGYTDADVLEHRYYGTPGASWMPSPITTSSTITVWSNLSGTPLPSQWTPNWINSTWNKGSQYIYILDNQGSKEYIISGDLTGRVSNAVNSKYNKEYSYKRSNPSEAYQKSNSVTNNHIYNTAIITPYSTGTYAIEEWNGKTRTINGALIELPSSERLPIPGNSYASWGRQRNPTQVYNYETRYGKNGDLSNRPNVNLMFGTDSSWREVENF